MTVPLSELSVRVLLVGRLKTLLIWKTLSRQADTEPQEHYLILREHLAIGEGFFMPVAEQCQLLAACREMLVTGIMAQTNLLSIMWSASTFMPSVIIATPVGTY